VLNFLTLRRTVDGRAWGWQALHSRQATPQTTSQGAGQRANLVPHLVGLISAVLIATPAAATELESWRFDTSDNAIIFVTDEAVRPRAQLIFNPTRLVIDLPGVRLGGRRPQQRGSGAIREVRWGQFDANTARLVIELEPGYTLDPEQIRVEGRSPTEWVIQIPEPEALDRNDSTASQPVETQPPELESETEPSDAEVAREPAELEAIELTEYGFYLRLSGARVPAELQRERRGRRYVLDLANTVLADDVDRPAAEIESFDIEELEIAQEDTDPPSVRITLRLNESADWQVNETAAGDVIIQPGRRLSDRPTSPPEDETDAAEPSPEPTPEDEPEGLSTALNQIQAITFDPGRSALQIRATGALTYEVEREGDRYRFRFPNTSVETVTPVDLAASSRLLQVQWDQDGEDAILEFEAAPDVQVGQPVPDSAGFRQRQSSQISIPLARPFWRPGSAVPPVQMPDIGNRRPTIVLDPGHGGRDPGAIGIRGLREVDIVNAVTPRVRELLEQQGVRVVMTRTDNRTLELETRVQVAERTNATVFISIHANAINMSRPDVNGIETFHASAEGRVLAAAIQESLLEATGSPSRGVKAARFYVIRSTSMPAALVEMGFVTGAEDAPRMETAEYRELLARAIARGILQYIRQNR